MGEDGNSGCNDGAVLLAAPNVAPSRCPKVQMVGAANPFLEGRHSPVHRRASIRGHKAARARWTSPDTLRFSRSVILRVRYPNGPAPAPADGFAPRQRCSSHHLRTGNSSPRIRRWQFARSGSRSASPSPSCPRLLRPACRHSTGSGDGIVPSCRRV